VERLISTLQREYLDYHYVVVDMTESLIQGPKKTKSVVFRQEKASYNKDPGDYQPEDP
jgi:hypothetical protein